MKIVSFITGMIGLSAMATSALAEPYCSELLDRDTLEPRYQRLAPIHSSTETGWIFGHDQLDYRYVLTSTEQALLADLVSELAARGTQLAMLIAPPRPVVAGQEVVDKTSGQSGLYDLAAQANAFHQMIGQMNEAGAVVPDLLALTELQPAIAEAYYFHRDTHWTNFGAAHSALALAAELEGEYDPAFDPAALTHVELAEETGSLSGIVTATCHQTPDSEFSTLFDYTSYLPQANDLFSDNSSTDQQVVLLGTSFSDRNRRDQYQTADALSAALQRPVLNRSVSGGGMVGPFETYILTSDFAEDQPELIIWEFPYTYELRERELRRLLGALYADETARIAGTYAIGADRTELHVSGEGAVNSLLGLRMTAGSTRDMTLRLRFEDGSDSRIRLRRKARMEEIAVLDTWWVSLHDFDAPLASLTIELNGESDLRELQLLTVGTSS